MAPRYDTTLPRREREIMDLLHLHGSMTVTQIIEVLDDELAPSTVRTLLARLVDRGFLVSSKRGRGLVYRPRQRKQSVAAEALDRVLTIFFQGALSNAVSLHLRAKGRKLTPKQLEQLQALLGEDEPRDPEDQP